MIYSYKRVQTKISVLHHSLSSNAHLKMTRVNYWLPDNENVVCGNIDEARYPKSVWFIKNFKENSQHKTAVTSLIRHNFS